MQALERGEVRAEDEAGIGAKEWVEGGVAEKSGEEESITITTFAEDKEGGLGEGGGSVVGSGGGIP